VMDAAVFPSSVGVNPSHTIAAVAERNIALFIRRQFGVEHEPPLEKAPLPAAAGQVVVIKKSEEKSEHVRPEIQTGPAKLVWRERLKGFFVSNPPFIEGAVPAEHLFAVNAGVDVFHECERQGALLGQRMELEVTATVPDLDAMVDGRAPMVTLTDGRFSFESRSGNRKGSHGLKGELELQLGGTEAAPLARPTAPVPPRTGGMVYRMSDGADAVLLYGFKQLTDDPGLDAWLDLTTLYVDVTLGGRLLRGILRVSITDFLRDQLPSFRVEKAGLAPEQQLWALGQFGRFFLGRVGRIYMPEWL
jgi:hypothetical protein